MGKKAYRLGEYKIIESGIGELRWEAHSGFAEFQEGKCFRKGTILFIGSAENDQMGFLKGDFLDHIKAFPEWSKTRYYCSASEIYHCKTGKRVAKQEMLMWMLDPGRGEGGSAAKDGAFRLERYEITRKKTGQTVWKAAPGPNTVSKGTCTVLEGILFFESAENTEFHLIGRQFAANLEQLPKWDQTEYYCPKSSLFDCKSWNNAQEERRTWPRARKATGKYDNSGKVGSRIRFKPKGSDTWKKQVLIFFHRAKKFFIYAAEVLRLMISFSFTCSIRFGREIKRMWRLKKGKRSSVHHPEDQT